MTKTVASSETGGHSELVHSDPDEAQELWSRFGTDKTPGLSCGVSGAGRVS